MPAVRHERRTLPADIAAMARLCDGVFTGLGWLDDSLRLRWANETLRILIGRDELPATGLAPHELAGPDEAPRLVDAFERASSGGEIMLASVQLRARPESVDLRIRGAGGPPGGVLLEVHRTSVPATVPVGRSLRSLAHELKNPLGGLRGAAQLISRRVLDADLRAYAEIIVAEVDRLGSLTGRLLAPVAQRAMSQVNVHAVLERVRLLLVADGVEVLRDYDPSLPEVCADPDRLVQVMLNLTRNALEAGAGRVWLRSRFDHAAALPEGRVDALRIDVIDDGAGVPHVVRSTLFLPLVSGREHGTGLGLAIAHEIVAEHGGRIAFESAPGRTTFSVWLPVRGAAR